MPAKRTVETPQEFGQQLSRAERYRLEFGREPPDEPRGDEAPPAGASFYVNYAFDDRVRYLRYGYDSLRGDWRRVRGDAFIRDLGILNVDGALNVGGWVFESSGWVREPGYGKALAWEDVRRGDARVVRDFERRRSRLSVGDVPAGTSFLAGPEVGGVRYERDSYLFGGTSTPLSDRPVAERSRSPTPLSDRDPRDGLNAAVSFFMPEAGEVEVYEDGMFRRRFRLPAGRHRVGGFSGGVGRNRVRLLLRMESGATEEVPFEYVLSDPRVMARGDVRYAVVAGARRGYALSPACYAYDLGEPVAGVDYAYGVHHAAGAGFSALASRRGGLGGVRVEFDAWGLGLVDLRAIGSYASAAGPDSVAERSRSPVASGRLESMAGGRLEASYVADFRRLKRLSLTLRGYCQTKYYGDYLFDELYAGMNGRIGGFSGDFAMPVWRGSVSATGSASLYRETGTSTPLSDRPVAELSRSPTPLSDRTVAERSRNAEYNYGVRLSQGFGRSYFSAGVGGNARGGVHSPYFTLNTSHLFGSDLRLHNHAFSASVDAGMISRRIISDDDDGLDAPDSRSLSGVEMRSVTDDLEWSYGGLAGWRWSNGASGAGSRAYSAGAKIDNDRLPAVSAALRHGYNRAAFDAGYDVLFGDYTGNYDRLINTVRARLSGALMFADGLWALGRPVGAGGFVLVGGPGARVNVAGGAGSGSKEELSSSSKEEEMSHSGWLGAAYNNRILAYWPTEFTVDWAGGASLGQGRNWYYAAGGYKRGFALRGGE